MRYFSYIYMYTQSARFARAPVPHKGAHDALWELGERIGIETFLGAAIHTYGCTGFDWLAVANEDPMARLPPDIKHQLAWIKKELNA